MAGIILNRNRQVPAEETPAFGGIAERFRRAGDLDRAIALCRDGLKRFPDQLSARVTLGWSLLDKGQYDAARAELEQVLRRAPDNLAAIRGLAELHDRSEGAMSSEAEQESWRSAEAAVADAPEPAAVEPAADPLAPIQVALGGHSTEQDAPEILHTAAHAGQPAAVAATTFEPQADFMVAPVELEDAAAASMAASEPAPFFVVEPGDAAAASIESTVETFDTVELDGGVEPAVEMLLGETPAAAAAAWDDAPDVQAETASAPEWSLDQPVEAARFDTVETLEDVDEAAGQELADAIKALEEATRRVEAKFAVPAAGTEPAASAEEIAAFEFLDAAGNVIARQQPASEQATPVIDARHDGAFELVAPDLTSLTFEAAAGPVIDVDGDYGADSLNAAFDFDAAREAEEAAAALAEAERLAVEEAARLEAERLAVEEAARLEAERLAAEEAARLEAERLAVEEAARLEAERLAAEEAARLEAERLAAEEAARLEAERLAAEEAARLEAERLAAEEAARLEAERLAAEEAARLEAERLAAEEAARLEAERLAAEEAARLEAERLAAEEAARLDAERTAAEAAAASDRTEPPAAASTGKKGFLSGWFGRSKTPASVEPPAAEREPEAAEADADTDDAETPVAALIATDPVIEPVVSTGAIVDAVAAYPDAGAMPAATRQAATVAALERFLRQVQARQLQLRSQTVA